MDEAFWSSVVKRWSDASENVIRLKKELAILEEERASHRCHSAVSSSNDVYLFERTPKQRVEATSTVETSCDDPVTTLTIRDELQDAEIGLGKAKEEYRKLQQDLAASSQMISELTFQNQKLVREHSEEIKRLREEYEKTDAKHVRGSPSVNESLDTEAHNHRLSTSTLNSAAGVQLVIDLEQQIETLKKSVENSEADQHERHQELIITREKLHKAEQNIKTLLASIVKLQTIARHPVYGSLHPGQISDTSLHSASRKSSRISFTSNHSHLRQNLETKQPVKASALLPVDSLRFPIATSQIDERTIIEQDSFMLTFLPPKREKALSKLPPISDMPVVNGSDNVFDRAFLKHILGEGVQSLIEHFSSTGEIIDKKTLMSSYLCPTLDHHPWCPSNPGQHGFIFVCFGKDKDSYKSPVTRNLFVGLPKSQGKHRIFRYLGKYRVARVEPLAHDEWAALSEETRVMYANLTREKGNDTRSVVDILSAYDSGKNQIPCVQLQCIAFDQRLYAALISLGKSERI